ncbi:hypothetical protein C3F09_00940 [candidate division GN15 bacterium]|uniref:VanZ-like domain-containing protein n=1 Tax=candidate division GN15 bacterium TaxID=2072418 RepID=A0A855X561_9BACT|nr:MAG: hypothetical protein C3F09_00940 [candidate division GN15 bacterium]
MADTSGNTNKWLRIAVLIGAILALLLFLELYDPWKISLLWDEIFNFGHLPLFGLISLLLLRVVTLTANRPLPALRRYGYALAIALVLGALSEIVQIGGPRDADIFDFLRDAIGALSFLLIFFAFDPGTRNLAPPIPTGLKRVILLVVALLLIGGSAHSVASVGLAWLDRDRAFPTLLSFEHGWEQRFVYADSATATVVSNREINPGDSANHVLRVDFQTYTYTGLILQDLYPDWRGYRTLDFSVYSISPRTEQLRLRIDDREALNQRDDRFERIVDILPGRNQISVPLEEVQHGPPDGRSMDMSRIKRIVLFAASQPRHRFNLWFGDFVLK